MAAKKDEAGVSRFRVEGKDYEIGWDTLTWAEIEELETYFDQAMDEIDWESGRGTMMLAYLAVRRKRSTFTLDDMRALKFDDVGPAEPERPTKPRANAGKRSS